MQSSTHFGSGAEDPPAEADLEAWRIPPERPDNEIGWGLPVSVVLARTQDAAVAVTHITAFTTGVAFNLAVRLRVAPDGLRRGGLYELISPYGPPGMDVDLDRRLLFGVEYADGRTATNLSSSRWPPKDQDDGRPVLMPNGGGGGEFSVDNQFWLSPVPPDGPFTFVCSWPALGIDETRHVIEHADLATASTRATTLWAKQPTWHEPFSPLPPERPLTGWFAMAARDIPAGLTTNANDDPTDQG